MKKFVTLLALITVFLTCFICGCNSESIPQDTHTHKFNDGYIVEVPTFTSVGKIQYVCLTCGEQKFEDIDVIPSKTLKLFVDGEEVVSSLVEAKKPLTHQMINHLLFEKKSDTIINYWYLDSTYSTKFDYNNVVDDDLILYGKPDEANVIVNPVKPFISEKNLPLFLQQKDEDILHITSYEMLKEWVGFVAFYDVTYSVYLFLDYTEPSKYVEEIQKAYSEEAQSMSFSTDSKFMINRKQGETACTFFIQESGWSDNAKSFVEDEIEGIYPQQEVLTIISGNVKRSEDFSEFNYKNNSKILPNISTSEQLFYAFEQGFTPKVIRESEADRLLIKAEDILRKIIYKDYNELDKVRAIYEYLIVNTAYDNYAYKTPSIKDNHHQYKAWSLEGVFDEKIAVCDGFSKAFILLCGIEGIPAIKVNGNDHAWNRVYIDVLGNGNYAWYGVDCTHGNMAGNLAEVGESYHEVLSYTQFLFTDVYKTLIGYSTSSYKDYSAKTSFDFYSYYSIIDGKDVISFKVDSASDFKKVLTYLKSACLKAGTKNCCMEVCMNDYNNRTLYFNMANVDFSIITSEKLTTPAYKTATIIFPTSD